MGGFSFLQFEHKDIFVVGVKSVPSRFDNT